MSLCSREVNTSPQSHLHSQSHSFLPFVVVFLQKLLNKVNLSVIRSPTLNFVLCFGPFILYFLFKLLLPLQKYELISYKQNKIGEILA